MLQKINKLPKMHILLLLCDFYVTFITYVTFGTPSKKFIILVLFDHLQQLKILKELRK